MPRRSCTACGGEGYPLEMGEETCPHCAGTGRDKNSDLWSEPCRGGCRNGKVTYCRKSCRPCRTCHGTGMIEY